MAEGARLEIVCRATYRGFESPSLRFFQSIEIGEGRVLKTGTREPRQVREEATVVGAFGASGAPGSHSSRWPHHMISRVLPLLLALGCPKDETLSPLPDTGMPELECPANTSPIVIHGGLEQWCESRSGIKHGYWVSWHPNSQRKIVGYYQFGKRHGPYREWFDNGTLQTKGQYDNGLRSGEWKYYYFTTQMWSIGAFLEGEEHGLWRTWYPNGNPQSEGGYIEGQEFGRWTTWYPNGKKSSEGDYEDGFRTGEWQYWDDAGRRISKEEFDDQY